MRVIAKIFINLAIIMLCVNSSACMIFSRTDGPPRFYVDANKIPNAQPKHEPLSKIGNKSYTIRGKTYHVLHKPKNYMAVGVASWYGSKFHNRSTANGERYDMLSMTAAHPTLPLPTYVRVTNLENGKQVIVKINDRGPFRKNRLIDLSYVAAKKLDMLRHGTALVKIHVINPEKKPSLLL